MVLKTAPKGYKLKERNMLQIVTPTDEQTKTENARQEELRNSVKDSIKGSKLQADILNDLGLSPEKSPDKKEEKKVKVEEKEEFQDEEEVADDAPQDDDGEEEVIPKSKIQPRIDKLTAQIKAQQRELDELKVSRQEPKDEVSKQLEAMTDEQLRAAKTEVRKAQIKNKDDDAKLNELLELEDKIEATIKGAPDRFARAQVDAYNRTVQRIVDSGDIEDIEKASPAILKIAKEIYESSPMFRKDVNGQATALELAVKHFKGMNTSGDKTKETELKRQVNNLKRKTTLDTKGNKGNIDQTKLDSLRKNAINGNLRQKVEFVKSHPAFNVSAMIPDEFK